MTRHIPGYRLWIGHVLLASLIGLAVLGFAAGAAAGPTPAASVARQITAIGETRYSDSFTGSTATSSTTVTVYTASNDAALISAIAGIPKDGVTVTVKIVAHSYAQLESVTRGVERDSPAMKNAGVLLTRVVSDPVRGIVEVALGAYQQGNPHLATYRQQLLARYGPGLIAVTIINARPATAVVVSGPSVVPWLIFALAMLITFALVVGFLARSVRR
jgi:hypothetical protein